MLQLSVNKHVTLKQIDLLDADDMFHTIDTQRSYLRKWLPFIDSTQTVDDSLDFIQSIYQDTQSILELVFVIHYDDQFVGLIGFKDTDRQGKKTEIGYWLSEKFQKKGIMTQSVVKLLHFAFDRLKVDHVFIKCAVGNLPSKNIPKRLHFTLKEIQKDGELLSDGNYTDLEVYSISKEAFYGDFSTK